MCVVFEYTPSQWGSNLTYDSPVVSVALTTYNQKDLSLKALRSMFSQDYPNLEVIISDDSSTDGTFEAVKECCEQYARDNGRFRIALNRNEKNIGITKNYELAFGLTSGELIVTAGGDDISHPDRVSRIVEEWLKTEKKATVIFHRLRPIDENDSPLGYRWWRLTLRNPIGASMAYMPLVVKDFPEISYPDSFEDNVFARRAFLYGDPLFIDDELIDYRVGCGATSSGNMRSRRLKISRSMVLSTMQNRLDIDSKRGQVSSERIDELTALIDEIAQTYSLEQEMLTAKTLLGKTRAFREYRKSPHPAHPFTRKWMMTYYIPLIYPWASGITSLIVRSHRRLQRLRK